MNLYHVKRTDEYDYDKYSDFVCAAPDEDTARKIDPNGNDWRDSWPVDPAKLTVRLIGTAVFDVEPGIICASFHAG